ncbi:hypothetical protein [Streptomyces sp. NPDC088178]|uniref:hypothetical protein n=1 Tax=Streptomyces sp. NPDC088178 TaxID=3365836 RepID=UPI0038176CE5
MTSPQKFRKKPVEIEAMLLPADATPTQGMAVYQWIESHIGSTQPAGDGPGYSPSSTGVTIDPADGFIVIRTLEGDMKVSLGDYVIRGVRNEFYPCKPDIFAVTYEPVETRTVLLCGNDELDPQNIGRMVGNAVRRARRGGDAV